MSRETNGTSETRIGESDRERISRVHRRERQLIWQLGPFGWLLIDAGVAVISVFLAYLVSPATEVLAINPRYISYLRCNLTFAPLLGFVSHVAGLHDSRLPRIVLDVVGRVCLVVGIAMMALNLLFWLFYYEKLGRFASAYICLFTSVGMVVVRILAWKMSDRFVQRICFLGDDKFRFEAAQFTDQHRQPYRTQVTVERDESDQALPLATWAAKHSIDEIVYDARTCAESDEALLQCLDEGIKVSEYTNFIENSYQLVPIDRIDAKWLLGASVELAHPYYNAMKRLTDVCIATVGLILASPILLLAMILIKLESRGPAIYSQERIGRFKRPFRIYKLRSMVADAESGGAQWAQKSDQRITRVGRILRLTRIDEIPQFWNVIRGDMSLVGPRPERPEFVELLAREIPFYLQRHLVKPGLTGWAQINYPYGASVADAGNKLMYDLYYVKRTSLLLDLQIALRTIGTIMSGSR